MRKGLYLLLTILSTFKSMHADEQMLHSIFVSPKLVKHSKLDNKRHQANTVNKVANIYASITPKIHWSVWPNFCLKHLQDDPEKCSAWTEDKNNGIQLEFLINCHSEAQIDRELIDRLRPLSHLIPERQRGYDGHCNYAYCPNCSQTVIRGLSYDENDGYYDHNDVYCYYYFPVYKCSCTGKWWLNLNDLSGEWNDIYQGWKFCNAPTIHYGYFDWHRQTYFRHLQNFLAYEEENSSCSCYWPQSSSNIKEISDFVYTELGLIFEDSDFDTARSTFSPYLKKRSLHGFLCGLLTHTFFYSQYRDILLDIDQHSFKEIPADDYQWIHNEIIDIEESIQQSFLRIYNTCIQKHPHPKIYYERGMVLFHRGDTLDSLEDIRNFIAYAENHHYHDQLTSDLYLKEGRLLSECLSYDEAIIALTKAIERNPVNAEGFFERAFAYFETGNFELALADYLNSGAHPKQASHRIKHLNTVTLSQGIVLGILQGGQDSVNEFVPSLLSCYRGISRGLWAFVSHPIDLSQDLIDSAYACIEFIKNNTTKKMLCKLVPELQECIAKWDQINDYTKGNYIGYIVGKYGVDIFIGTGSIKAIKLYRNLRKANALMTLETLSVSPKLAQEVLELAAKEEAARTKIFKSGNLKIQWDKQGKHIKGHKRYVPEEKRSILTHTNPQKLIDKYAGTGRKVGKGIPGKPGYKEIIDFEENIGYFIDVKTEESFLTNIGSIDYAKDGVHIIPRRPR